MRGAPAKPSIFISVSTGWAIRNFFQTGVVEQLASMFQVVVLAPPATCEGLRNLGYHTHAELVPVICGQEPRCWSLIRQAKKKVYLEGRQSNTEAIWEKYHPRPMYQRIGGIALKRLIRFVNPVRLYNVLEWLDLKLNKSASLADLFTRHSPVFLFSTHASTYFEELVLRNAVIQGVPSLFMILSWDHLSSKIVLHNLHHSILVWNMPTKQEILHTYPAYRDEQVRVVGIPQYDLYAQRPDLDYASWCTKYGLDPCRRTILFSTMPQVRHNQQHLILKHLLNRISEAKELPGDLQVLIKCHPFDTFSGYDELLGIYPVGIHRTALLDGQSKEDWIPSRSEMEVSRDALYHCTLNINIFSTVTIEAAYFNKPIIHIAFDPTPVVGRIPCHEYYNWDHFKPIVEKGASILVRSQEELISAVRRCLDEPDYLSEQRRELVRTYVGGKIGCAAVTLVEELSRTASELSSSRGVPCLQAG